MEIVTEAESLSSIKAQSDALSTMSEQIRYAINQYQKHGLNAAHFKHIIIAGLGGSGIGGHIVNVWFKQKLQIPLEVISDYSLPNYAGSSTLLIACSYSGNTEETLEIFHQAQEKNIPTLVVSSGGKLTQLGKEKQYPLYNIPAGLQPRMALGYSLTYLFLILEELTGVPVIEELAKTADELSEVEDYLNYGEELYEGIKKHLNYKIVVLADAYYYPVAVRFCQQIQENAKAEAFCHVVPESNHNVIESYYGQLQTIFFLLHGDTHERVSGRFDFLNSLLEVENNKVIHLISAEDSIASLYKIIFRLDWLSLAIARGKRVNALTVPNIASLKEFLEHL